MEGRKWEWLQYKGLIQNLGPKIGSRTIGLIGGRSKNAYTAVVVDFCGQSGVRGRSVVVLYVSRVPSYILSQFQFLSHPS